VRKPEDEEEGPMKKAQSGSVNLYLDIITEGDNRVIKCNQCGFVLCSESEDWKTKAKRVEEDLYEAMERYHITAIPAKDRKLVFRQYFCPHCSVAFDNEITEAAPIRRNSEVRGQSDTHD
jgi:acetone carboxylase gamma subunit